MSNTLLILSNIYISNTPLPTTTELTQPSSWYELPRNADWSKTGDRPWYATSRCVCSAIRQPWEPTRTTRARVKVWKARSHGGWALVTELVAENGSYWPTARKVDAVPPPTRSYSFRRVNDNGRFRCVH